MSRAVDHDRKRATTYVFDEQDRAMRERMRTIKRADIDDETPTPESAAALSEIERTARCMSAAERMAQRLRSRA